MLKLKDIKKTYVVDKQHFPALKNINLSFPNKGFISILGPSGCGKTTLLNLIGGLDQYTSGDLIINNKSTKKFTDRDWDAYRNKRVGFVFQTYNLVPHLTVLGNVELSMTLTGMNKKERQRKAVLALKRVGLKDAIKKKPNQLSGGQMQRVAIARSLVNNPEIVLADEPTGALDSVTSVQVMEILKEVAKDRLVIMVTHNDELANKYSTRIIRLKDGLVVSDTSPLRGAGKKEDNELEQEKNKHTHMSFFTALGSSARSLLTKKGRTIMTSVAASFGIIGVSLILALSNGFSNYVHNMEVMTASSVPITISPFVTTSVQIDTRDWKPWPEEQEIIPYDDSLSSITTVHHNKLTREYAQYCQQLVTKGYASSVLENHEGLDFNIITEQGTTGKLFKIDQYDSAGTTGSLISGISGLPSSIFHELYGGEDYIRSLYDVVAGRYPQNENELLLVCDRYNHIPAQTLYGLGYINDTADLSHISFNDIITDKPGEMKVFKAYRPLQIYRENGTATIETYEFDQESFAPTSPKTVQVNTYESLLSEGKQSELRTLFNSDEEFKKLHVVGVIRPNRDSQINLMPGSICYRSELKQSFINLMDEYKNLQEDAYKRWAISDFATDPTIWKSIVAQIYFAIASNNVSAATSVINTYFTFYDFVSSSPGVLKPLESRQLTTYLTNNLRFGNDDSMGLAANIKFDPETYKPDKNTYKNLVDVFAYINGYSTITSILVFPKDLSNKHAIFNYLDAYNVGKEEVDQIKYSDIASTITDAVGTMVDIISIVLIIFSSISLLVSCVMTGVITYTSVLERTKEIGILRAIGARKKDVGRLFEAESVIIGGVAGVIGILVTFIAQFPISYGLMNAFPAQNIGMICNLNPLHALLLIAVSILLTFAAGFIPARKAAKKDPVVALRTE